MATKPRPNNGGNWSDQMMKWLAAIAKSLGIAVGAFVGLTLLVALVLGSAAWAVYGYYLRTLVSQSGMNVALARAFSLALALVFYLGIRQLSSLKREVRTNGLCMAVGAFIAFNLLVYTNEKVSSTAPAITSGDVPATSAVVPAAQAIPAQIPVYGARQLPLSFKGKWRPFVSSFTARVPASRPDSPSWGWGVVFPPQSTITASINPSVGPDGMGNRSHPEQQ